MEDQDSVGRIFILLFALWICVGTTIGLVEDDAEKYCGGSAGLLILFAMLRIVVSPMVYLAGAFAYAAVFLMKLLAVIFVRRRL